MRRLQDHLDSPRAAAVSSRGWSASITRPKQAEPRVVGWAAHQRHEKEIGDLKSHETSRGHDRAVVGGTGRGAADLRRVPRE
jgi:hypothetical protein